MNAIETGIERRIPLGAGAKNTKITATARTRIEKLEVKAGGIDYRAYSGWREQLGTLGSGNHFVEVCLDESQQVWLVLHSGSRGVGNRIAGHHIKIAQKLMTLRKVALQDRDLAYLPEDTPEFQNYIRDLLWAQDYTLSNREEMMDRAMTELSCTLFGEAGHEQAITRQRINCHHNFTHLETHFGKNMWITRKGAIQMKRARRVSFPDPWARAATLFRAWETPHLIIQRRTAQAGGCPAAKLVRCSRWKVSKPRCMASRHIRGRA